MELWTVYDHPRDFPEHFVARKFVVVRGGPHRPTEDVMADQDLRSLRRKLAALGFVPLTRSPDDDPKIIEVWI